mmetsp:Transcript_129344/g.306890  ORF Transcript_129344/g.306890 Transcript_129344/m.306890 type:complete len:261 (-) Transcript_129344:385-1167(-)
MAFPFWHATSYLDVSSCTSVMCAIRPLNSSLPRFAKTTLVPLGRITLLGCKPSASRPLAGRSFSRTVYRQFSLSKLRICADFPFRSGCDSIPTILIVHLCVRFAGLSESVASSESSETSYLPLLSSQAVTFPCLELCSGDFRPWMTTAVFTGMAQAGGAGLLLPAPLPIIPPIGPMPIPPKPGKPPKSPPPIPGMPPMPPIPPPIPPMPGMPPFLKMTLAPPGMPPLPPKNPARSSSPSPPKNENGSPAPKKALKISSAC